ISKLTQLENENKELCNHIQRLKNSGTVSLSLIMKYLHPSQLSVEKKPQVRPKAFKFETLMTAESIVKKLENKENVK
ncbi:2875_t:CDS:1, partial [Dentiscutata heterogama]